jgi:hypothetical protein
LQVELHRRQAEPLAQPLPDELTHCPTGPQAERPPQLAWGRLDDPPPYWACLLGAQDPLAAPRRHPPSIEHAILALLAVALHPGVHRLAVDTDHRRGFALAQALPLDQDERSAPQLLLRRPADAANVTCLQPASIAATA